MRHTPNVSEGHESRRFMMDIIGLSEMKGPLIFSVISNVVREGRKSEKQMKIYESSNVIKYDGGTRDKFAIINTTLV